MPFIGFFKVFIRKLSFFKESIENTKQAAQHLRIGSTVRQNCSLLGPYRHSGLLGPYRQSGLLGPYRQFGPYRQSGLLGPYRQSGLLGPYRQSGTLVALAAWQTELSSTWPLQTVWTTWPLQTVWTTWPLQTVWNSGGAGSVAVYERIHSSRPGTAALPVKHIFSFISPTTHTLWYFDRSLQCLDSRFTF